MIDYVEIRNTRLELLGLIDTAKSIIWETQYYGAGAFEIFVQATPETIALLQVENFVTRVDAEGVGIIEAVNITYDGNDGRMIAASGRLAKAILDRRLITYINGDKGAATIFSGNVEARARGLVQDNAIACYRDKARTIPYTARNISLLQLGALAGLTAETEERKVIDDNLLTFTDEFLRQFSYGAKVIRDGGKLSYAVYAGVDRSIGNAAGNQPVIFSEDFDNLTGSNYVFDETGSKTFALVCGKDFRGDPFYAECNAGVDGLARREAFIASSTTQTVYEDTFDGDGVMIVDEWVTINGIPTTEPKEWHYEGTGTFTLSHAVTEVVSVTVEGEDARYKINFATRTIKVELPYVYKGYTLWRVPLVTEEVVVKYVDADEYRQQLIEEGKQKLATMIAAEEFSGSIDLANSTFVYGVDFELGDIVTVQDNSINKYLNCRVVAAAEVQDDAGYQVNIEFGAV